MISEHETEFAGLPIVDYDPNVGVANPRGEAYRVTLSWSEYDDGVALADRLGQFVADPRARDVPALVIGCWSYESGGSDEIVAAISVAAGKLPGLRAIFLGDIVGEESEISWIKQTNLSGLLAAYPQLEVLRVRGNDGLRFGTLNHPQLKTLIVETGGLSSAVIKEIGSANLPELMHLELWLGSDQYGWDGSVADLQPILSGLRFPKLEYLGLRDSEVADELAVVVAKSPIVRRLQTLDLSLGNMSDDGFRALLDLPTDGRLETLIVRHHYAGPQMTMRLMQQFPFVVDASDRLEPDRHGNEVYRYIAVSE